VSQPTAHVREKHFMRIFKLESDSLYTLVQIYLNSLKKRKQAKDLFLLDGVRL
jgi:hypothetical protein